MKQLSLILLAIYFVNLATSVPLPAVQSPKCLVELTQLFDNETLFFPILIPFVQYPIKQDVLENWDYPARADNLMASSNDGTHVDAPNHVYGPGLTVDKIPLDQLINVDSAVIDVRDKAANDRDYELTKQDILDYEQQYGSVKRKVILMMTAYDKKWPNREDYTGTPDLDASKMHFPGFGADVAKFLIDERNVFGFGLDTLSLDPGRQTQLPAHRVILGSNNWGLENMANLDKLPPSGAKLVIMPLYLHNGPGGLTRAVGYFNGKCRQ